jgi:phosphoglycolate phosphatase
MGLKLAIWDMDGTIVDSREVITQAMGIAFEQCNLPVPDYDDIRKTIGLGLEEVCFRLAPPDLPRQRLGFLVEAYRQSFSGLRGRPDFEEPLYAGAMESLKALRADGWLIGMATGKSHRGIRAIFEAHPLESFFDTIWCADDGPSKPHPFMCQQAVDALGVDAARSVMIGDATHDMKMGRAAGVRTLGVSWGFGTAEELAPDADEVHHSFETLDVSLANLFS